MAAAGIIGAAIGVILLIIIAYILTGTTLISAETMANAQKDLTLQNEARLGTNIAFNSGEKVIEGSRLNFSVTNSGNEVISDFDYMDVFTYNTSGLLHYSYDKYTLGETGNWSITRFDNDFIHPNQLDPGEKMWISAAFLGENPYKVQIVTSNGVYASAVI